MPLFEIVTEMKPAGDQPKAIAQLSDGIRRGMKHQTLHGATGTGKTFTMAHIIAGVEKPTLIISPNKTLAAQLTSEFRSLFPKNAVEYFVSYYDFYQPEAYVPEYDLYIEKDASINEEIDKFRHRATQALLTRRDVIVVASVSCIFGLGSPQDYREASLRVRKGETKDRDDILARLVQMRYERNDVSLQRGRFRVKGDVIELCAAEENIMRLEILDNTIERIVELDPVTGSKIAERDVAMIFPAKHFVPAEDRIQQAADAIEKELDETLAYLKRKKKRVEAARLEERMRFDIEMIRETGYCPGIENYSRYFSGRRPGEPPHSLIDFFPEDYLLIIDESHVTVPQLRGMYEGDRSRKEKLISYGFRLPSALDNRPLHFKELEKKMNQTIYSSATPGKYEMMISEHVVEQVIRPTGLVDPEVVVKPSRDRMKDLVQEIRRRTERNERVLITTLTKKMAEKLASHLNEESIRVRYLHSDIETLKRVELLKDLRLGNYDVLVGVNLLREGLDLPEVSLVAILDADREGYLRNETSLIQTIGRASRNISGQVIMYADSLTDSMRRAIGETNRRRKIQINFNEKNGIKPESVRKEVRAIIDSLQAVTSHSDRTSAFDPYEERIAELEQEMLTAAENLEFERAAQIRDMIRQMSHDSGSRE